MFYKIKNTKEYKKINILWGLIGFKTRYSDLSLIIRIFGLELLTFKFLNGKLLFQFNFKIPLFFINKDKFNANLVMNFVKNNYGEYDSIYLFYGAPSGETYIILNLLDALIKKNNSQKPLLIVDNEAKYELCRIFQPNIPVKLCNNFPFFYSKNTIMHKLKKCIIYTFFPAPHYLKQDVLINESNEHYYSYIIKSLDINEEQNFINVETSNKVKEKVAKFIKENSLKNFIIISPEANTCSEGFVNWELICRQLKKAGYDIVINAKNKENYLPDTIPVFLPYEEMLELTNFASAFVGLRSGFVEILSQKTQKIPFYVIYSPFPKRGVLKAMKASKALSGFSLKKLPNVNIENVFEYNIDKITEKDLLNEILKKRI